MFSSDYPHFEGRPRPTAFYGDLLRNVDDDLTSGFLSRNIASACERMGDPLL